MDFGTSSILTLAVSYKNLELMYPKRAEMSFFPVNMQYWTIPLVDHDRLNHFHHSGWMDYSV
jgi:hypothetical protein